MRISFSPVRRDDTLTVVKSGDVLTINGEAFDFSSLPEGATIEDVPSDWIVGPVHRTDGEIVLTLILPHGPNPPQPVAFPEPIVVAEDGPINLPGVDHVDA